MMKKTFYVVAALMLATIFSMVACVHELPHDNCASDPIHIAVTHTDAVGGQNTGTITATATGGSGFQYSLNGASYSDTGYFTGLHPNTSYQVVARNAWGCTDTAIVDIGDQPAPNPCAGLTIVVNLTKTDATLSNADGSITASATPAGTYTYSLNGGAFQSSGAFTGLVAGNYTVTAKNADGCTGAATIAVGSNNPCAGVTITVSTTQTNPTTGQSNGSITASAAPAGTYTYSLNGGAFQASGTFSGLAAGSYTVTAKNANGCTGVKTVTLTGVDPCAGVTVTVTTTQTNPTTGNSNGSITATATGGTGFTYSLNGGAYQASGTFSNLAAGNYTITAKNSNGCTGATTVSLGATNPCAGVTITVSNTQSNPTTGQSNGSITATAAPAGTYTYSLNGGAYQASGTFSGLAAGSYTVTAKNANGCTGVKTVTLTAVDPCAGVTITVTLSKSDPTTGNSNGTITASASPAGTYTYSLNGGAYQAGATFSGLAAGSYTVTAKSAAGCLGSATITLTAQNPCNSITISLSNAIVNVLPCASPTNNGKITVTATGSTGFTYNINGGAYQASNIFSSLAAGTYTVGVKDANGCTKTATASVGTQPMGPQFTAVQSLILSRCSGSNCHTNGHSAAGYNFDQPCSIVTAWSAIRNSCVNSNSMPNPPQPQLTTAEKQTITTWINGGHTYGN